MTVLAASLVSDGSDKLSSLRQETGGRLGSWLDEYADDLPIRQSDVGFNRRALRVHLLQRNHAAVGRHKGHVYLFRVRRAQYHHAPRPRKSQAE